MRCERCGFEFYEETTICPRCKNPLPVNKQKLHIGAEEGSVDRWKDLNAVPEDNSEELTLLEKLTTGNKRAIAAIALRIVFYILTGLAALIWGKSVLDNAAIVLLNWMTYISAIAIALLHESEEEEQFIAKVLGAILVVDGVMLVFKTGTLIIAFISNFFK